MMTSITQPEIDNLLDKPVQQENGFMPLLDQHGEVVVQLTCTSSGCVQWSSCSHRTQHKAGVWLATSCSASRTSGAV
jgi:hypothetical protein